MALAAVAVAVAPEALVVEVLEAMPRWEALPCKESNLVVPHSRPMACLPTTCIRHTDAVATHRSSLGIPPFLLLKVRNA